MHNMAMILNGVVINLAQWDGVSSWDPVGAGLCQSIVDVTSQPQVSMGWTYSNGTFTAPTSQLTSPDVPSFTLAVLSSLTISNSTKLVVANWEPSLSTAVAANNSAIVTQIWNLLISEYSISSADQLAVSSLATQYSVPGISA